MSTWIFTTMPVSGYLFNTSCCRAPPPPRAIATAPRPPHTAAQGVVSARSGANSQLGEPGAWKGALPGTGLIGPRMVGDNKTMEIPARTLELRLSTYTAAAAARTTTIATTATTAVLLYMLGGWLGRWVGYG